jgi:hypothetical protein
VQEGTECTTRYLREQGWTGLQMDGSNHNESINLHQEFFTAENIAGLFAKYNVPKKFDHMTVDIDMNTFYVLQAVLQAGYRPRSLVTEYNRNLSPWEAIVVRYEDRLMWVDESCYFGASPYALHRLLTDFGYFVLGLDQIGVNVFAVQGTEVGGDPPMTYEGVLRGSRSSLCQSLHYDCQNQTWVEVPNQVDLTQKRGLWQASLLKWRLMHENLPPCFEQRIFTKYPENADQVSFNLGVRLDRGCV